MVNNKIIVDGKKIGENTILWYALVTFKNNPKINRLTGYEWKKLVRAMKPTLINPRTGKPQTDQSIRVVFIELSRTRDEGGKSHINQLCFARHDRETDTFIRR
ncbi:MAG: hypothetical protein MPEBLZ_03837 [Candidatus Methanoperedens nitroreducens]|uniref:Uncharacterized protein n=1 Tax=Candidatus Methanoperedens nitratireducens TaxID=1392998 RepID=A0A0P8DVM5_9EURY|nr:hypothetical protein [Candidatus Methanoperedens sp. BLZ2]KAB2944515.1 MAG: hypothetical protein F9K14_14310 [Candidatus Methanoperedens sp.]KPQ41590.1 MAG: hypothetical protein MPEBLZ_03837 [Candidatus Methanoperedens sp. BLZ1]MBZ0176284.1 hypothetical protein [Candidatus Methanoperedens nitroreducens]CAG1006870.1 hypothetical protein METP2_03803 [Methanosarcinales archaeon]MCX9077217.1 hypothetical protein [Candidatus Methanoperedens sp.]